MKWSLIISISISLAGVGRVWAATAPADGVEVRIAYAAHDSVFRFYYPFDDGRHLMYDYRSNRAAFDAMDALLRTAEFRSRIVSIEITGSACLIGTSSAYNLALSRRRAGTLAGWLRYKYPDLNVPIQCRAVGRNQSLFGVLQTRGYPPAAAYRQLRYASVYFRLTPEQEPDSVAAEPVAPVVAEPVAPVMPETPVVPEPVVQPAADTVGVAPAELLPEVKTDTDSIGVEPALESAEPVPATTEPVVRTDSVWQTGVVPVHERVPLFALKTNLLYDLALTPNIEVEVPLGRRWSVGAEFQHGWWLKKSNTFCWQLETLGVEGRYWLGDRANRRVLTGWFAGLFAGVGVCDFQLKSDRGLQSDFTFAGLSGGYATQLGDSPWGMEFSVGAGYLGADYTRYRVYQDRLVHRGAQMRFNGIVPLKAKLSLVYMLSRKAKKNEEKKGGNL